MRFNFLEIKRRTDKNVFILLLLLILSYFIGLFLVAYVLLLLVSPFMVKDPTLAKAFHWVQMVMFERSLFRYLLAVSIIIGLFSWLLAGFSLRSIVDLFSGYPPDPSDRYHQQFINMIEEIKIASGIHDIEPVILPDSTINAFSCQDLSGRIVIGITEGALTKLTRQELEAVLAHEMGHIMAGDVITTTMFSAIVSVYSAMKNSGLSVMRSSTALLRGGESPNLKAGGVIFHAVWVFFAGLVVFAISQVWSLMNYMLIMLISRQREYRADALAIKIIRDPVSLARALAKIEHNRRSARLIPEENLGALFISNPFSEGEILSESLWDELFSTHPPLSKRIDVICNIAGISEEDLRREVAEEERIQKRRTLIGLSFLDDNSGSSIEETKWMILKDGQWEGPFHVEDLAKMELSPHTFVRPEDDEVYFPLEDNAELFGLLFGAEERDDSAPFQVRDDKYRGVCPRCGVRLQKAEYEGVIVRACPDCYGVILDRSQLKRILLREEVGFSEEIRRWGDALLSIRNKETRLFKPEPSFFCPVCGEVRACPTCRPVSMMYRRMFSIEFLIEVDVCRRCDRIWFDKYELELLQYMFEKLVRDTNRSPEEVWDDYIL